MRARVRRVTAKNLLWSKAASSERTSGLKPSRVPRRIGAREKIYVIPGSKLVPAGAGGQKNREACGRMRSTSPGTAPTRSRESSLTESLGAQCRLLAIRVIAACRIWSLSRMPDSGKPCVADLWGPGASIRWQIYSCGRFPRELSLQYVHG